MSAEAENVTDNKDQDKNGEGSDNEEKHVENGEANDEHSPEPFFIPIIYLPEVVVNSGEDDEEVMIKLRAKLYRYAHECDPPEWKERGTGDVKILKHVVNGTCRILMRRDKTLKICANHFVMPWMGLKPNCGSEKAWVWKVQADYADQEPKPETLAIKFGSVENARRFAAVFEEAIRYVVEAEAARILAEEGEEKTDKEKEVVEAKGDDGAEETKTVTDGLSELSVKSDD